MQWTSPLAFVYLLLLLLPFFPGQNGKENVFTEWPADIISVWEGDSINITCSKNSPENEVGTYLTTSRPPANIVYISSRNTSFIHPNFTNRITCLNEGASLTITVHNVRESDSNTYLCTSYIKKNDRHIKREWMSVTVVVKAKTNRVIEQSPLSVRAQQGESISITCVLKNSFEDEWIVLLKTHMQPEKVFCVSSQNTTTIFPTFANRLEYSKQEKKLVITLHNLQENDTDVYVCAAGLKNSSLLVNESGTMVLVKDEDDNSGVTLDFDVTCAVYALDLDGIFEQLNKGGKQTECSIGSLAIYIPTIVVGVLLLSAVIFYILNHINMKKFFQKKKTNVVYEDMSFSSRSNTLVRANTYSTDN